MTDVTAAGCMLCAPNCARCSIKYNNCISCRAGWVLFVDPDTATDTVVSDYCVPGDGVGHYHPMGDTNTDSSKWGFQTDGSVNFVTNTPYSTLHECLQGFLERPI